MTALLASVKNYQEAMLALECKVGIIDLKQPELGALGALSIGDIKAIAAAVAGRCPVSATIGDLPTLPDIVSTAVADMSTTGVDYVKIGFFKDGDWPATLISLTAIKHVRLIAVLFADQQPDFSIIPLLKKNGFSGVMLDTADKGTGSLTALLAEEAIEAFVDSAKKNNLLCGLAGSLGISDVAKLTVFNPDYLGFRGALCRQRVRTAKLDADAVKSVQAGLTQALLNRRMLC